MKGDTNMKNKLTFNLLISTAILFVTTTPSNAASSRYRLSWRDDPATTMVVGWDQISGKNPTLQYSTKTLDDNNKEIKTHNPDRTESYLGMVNTFARLTNLKPDTLYNFRITDSEGVSDTMRFKTAPAKNQPFPFITGGDSRNNRKARRAGNLLVSKLRPLFVLFGGDYAGHVSQKLLQNWLDDWQTTRSEDGRMYPIIPTHGNHENNDFNAVNKIFDVPNANTFYSLTIAKNMMQIYALNSELQFHAKPAWQKQNRWIKSELEKNKDATWKIAAYHRPMRPHTKHKTEMVGSIDAWADLFYEYGMHLVVESDSHTVKRTYPIRPDSGPDSFESFIRDDKRGTTYIGEGSWGAPLRPANDDKPWTMASGSFHQLKLVHVFKDHLDIRCIKFDNSEKLTANREKDCMAIPANLNIWTPESGAVLRINQHEK